jgi:hypothetical protein
MSLINWVFDFLARDEIIDLTFIQSDLQDISVSDSEIYESLSMDNLANTTIMDHNGNNNIPIGKLVL